MSREEAAEVHTFNDLLLRLLVHRRDQGRDLGVRLEFRDRLRVSPNRLHEADGVRIDPLRVLGEVTQAVRNLVPQPEQIANLLEQRDDLRVKVDHELQVAVLLPVLGDVEQATADLEVAPVDIGEPRFVDRARVQLLPERLALRLEALTLGVMGPLATEDVLDALHVVVQLALDLLRPCDRTGDRRLIAELSHSVGLGRLVAELELVLERADVVLHRVDQLRLIFRDGATDLGANEERVELGENAEHLVRVLGAAEPVPQPRDDVVLDAGDSLVVRQLTSDPEVGALWKAREAKSARGFVCRGTVHAYLSKRPGC